MTRSSGAPERIESGSKPLVTVVVPMLNELGSIEECLGHFAAQTYGTDHLEVVVIDGGSTDGSRDWVDSFCVDNPWCRVVENPRRKASSAFNCGVEVAKGEVLMLFSGHGEPMPDYVEQSVAVLAETGVAGVGGRYVHIGSTPTSNAIGLAMVSPFGMASPHRTVTDRREVDTISHPAYVTETMRIVGPFDESLERNSDYEFNFRMRQAGYSLIVDPAIGSIYHPRPSLKALGRQFWCYGRWKKRVISRLPGSMKLRHAVPPATVTAVALSPVLAVTPVGRKLIAAGAVSYLVLVGWAVVKAKPREHHADPAALAASFAIMHASWGAGFMASVLEDSWKAVRR